MLEWFEWLAADWVEPLSEQGTQAPEGDLLLSLMTKASVTVFPAEQERKQSGLSSPDLPNGTISTGTFGESLTDRAMGAGDIRDHCDSRSPGAAPRSTRRAGFLDAFV